MPRRNGSRKGTGGVSNAAKQRKRSGLEERHSKNILGSLLCYDRIVINGILQRLQNPAAINGMLLDQNLGAFDLKQFVLPLTQEIRQNAEDIAKKHDLKIQFMRSHKVRKEKIVADLFATRGHAPGLVCILSAMENCSTFGPRKAGRNHKFDWIKAV